MGLSVLDRTSSFLRGVRYGYRLAGRSLIRRLFVTFLVTAILWGVSIAMAWELADRFLLLETGSTAAEIITVTAHEMWNRLYR